MIEQFKNNFFEIALFEPEIAANTGNIIRLSACLNVKLHLIYPIGFNFDDKHLRRAGLDYHDLANIEHHDSAEAFFEKMSSKKIYCLTTKTQEYYWNHEFEKDCILLFGPETRGLPSWILETYQDSLLKIPMASGARSLNLSNSVAIVSYEVAKQFSCNL